MDIDDLENMSGLDLVEYIASVIYQNGGLFALDLNGSVFLVDLLSREEFDKIQTPDTIH